MRRPTALRLTAVLLVLGLMSACGSDPKRTPEATRGSDVTEVTVTGAFGEVPEVQLPSKKPDGSFSSEVLEEGDGDPLVEGQFFVANYGAYLWPASSKDRKEDDEPLFDTFASGVPQSFTLTAEATMAGVAEGLEDASVGSRVLLVIPPDKGFGEEGQTELGVGPKDTLVFVFDVVDAFEADQTAEGTPVEPDAALPTVADGEDGPTATVPATPAPTDLLSQVLIKGDGAEVESGQLLVVQYRGQLWKDGSEFDSSWSRDSPTAFPIGTGGVISGWDKTLVGQTVGSRVLLVVPPAEGYGEAGSPPKIAGDDTLVFIVDILGAYGTPVEPTASPTETPTG